MIFNMNQYNAAQTKAVIAQYLGDHKMWREAVHQLAASLMPEPGHWLRKCNKANIILADASINFESYGDLMILDGDAKQAECFISLDYMPELINAT